MKHKKEANSQLGEESVHARAIKRFDLIQSAMHGERTQCLEDRRFCSLPGAQWEGVLGEQFKNKLKIEVNKVQLAVTRIINEYRNNRITVDFISKVGESADQLAETCDNLYRADEQDSCADEAYDNAFEEAVTGGFGAWRLRTEYEDDEDPEDDRQRIRIEPIYDADSSVFFDLQAKRQSKSDATHCFVITSMTKDSYIEEYDEDPETWDKSVHNSEFDWYAPDVVFVAEYYEVESETEIVQIWESRTGEEVRYLESEFEENEDLKGNLKITEHKFIREKKIKRPRVHKYVLSGGKILEDCGLIAGTCIPIVPVYGKRWFIDNIERCMGHVRLSKDAQRLKNMQLSKLGEISAMSPVEKPIFTREQMAGNEVMWSEDSVTNYPFLLVNSITDSSGNKAPAGAIGYTKAPDIPPAMAALLQITEQDMKDLLGNQQEGEKVSPNLSGRAVELVQNKLDMQAFIYMSNMAKAVKRSGEIWLPMAKDVFVEPKRKMKGVGLKNDLMTIELMRPVLNKDTGKVEIQNDMSRAKFDVVATPGPSSVSARAATVRAITGIMSITTDPETQVILLSMAMSNMEGEGLGEYSQFFRNKLLKIGAVKPTEQEEKELKAQAENAQPDPNAQFLRASAQEAEANAAQARAKTVLTIAQSEGEQANVKETIAKTAKIVSDMSGNEQKQVLDIIDRVSREANSPLGQEANSPLGQEQSIGAIRQPPSLT